MNYGNGQSTIFPHLYLRCSAYYMKRIHNCKHCLWSQNSRLRKTVAELVCVWYRNHPFALSLVVSSLSLFYLAVLVILFSSKCQQIVLFPMKFFDERLLESRQGMDAL